MKRETQYYTGGHAAMVVELKRKITSAEYQKLSVDEQSKYMRFCGSDEVYYLLSNLNN